VVEPQEKGNAEPIPKKRKMEIPFWREKIIILVMVGIFAADQVSKALIVKRFETPNDSSERVVVIKGFLDLIHRTNDGAAFSILQGKNNILAVISFIAMGGLIRFRHHFDNGTRVSKLALGLLMGGILGNLADRVFRESVVDFVRVYVERKGGVISEWPAFNIADAAICAGVGFLFCIAWTEGSEEEEATQ
jgi:signal peptidase II